MNTILDLFSDFVSAVGGLFSFVIEFPLFAVLILLFIVGVLFSLIRKEF